MTDFLPPVLCKQPPGTYEVCQNLLPCPDLLQHFLHSPALKRLEVRIMRCHALPLQAGSANRRHDLCVAQSCKSAMGRACRACMLVTCAIHCSERLPSAVKVGLGSCSVQKWQGLCQRLPGWGHHFRPALILGVSCAKPRGHKDRSCDMILLELYVSHHLC